MIKKYEIFQEEFLSHYLRRSAKMSLESGRAGGSNAPLQFMNCVMFCAFALEGFFNYVGSEIVKGYEYMETSLKPIDKFCFLSEQLELPVDSGARPAQTVKKMFEFRNFMAHGKAIRGTAAQEIELINAGDWETFKPTATIDSSKINDDKEKKMIEKWEDYRALWTEDFASRCLDDIESIMISFAEAAELIDAIREVGAANPIWERVNRKIVREL